MVGRADFWIPDMEAQPSNNALKLKPLTKDDKMNNLMTSLRNKKPIDILRECGQEDQVPVDLGAIFDQLGIRVLAMDFSEIEKMEVMKENVSRRGRILGAVIAKGDTTAIFYSKADSVSSHRYRFTVAHELGHLCLGEIDHIEFRHDGDANEASEVEANIFAGELLIPKKSLERISRKLIVPTITSFASVFEVSETVMAARLSYLKEDGFEIHYV